MILLAPDACAVYPPGPDSDAHGWRFGPDVGDAPLWTGMGNVQMAAGIAGIDAAQSGGHGPFDPNSTAQGEVYLPLESDAHDGCVLVARGKAFTLAFVRAVPDPSGGPIGCLVGTVSEVEQWQPASL